MSSTEYFPGQTRTLFRSRHGLIFGVCRGLADYSVLPVFWIRLAVILLVCLTAFFPVAFIYLLAAIFLRPEPVIRPETPEAWAFYHTYAQDRLAAINALRQKFEALERRTQRMESLVASKEAVWEERLRGQP